MANESDIRRAERKRQRELKDARKEELSEATSSFERRQIKAKYAEPRENLNEGRKESNLDDSMSQREAAAGLNLSGNNTTYGRGQQMPTMSEREAAAGLNLFGNDTTVGRDSFYDSEVKALSPGWNSNFSWKWNKRRRRCLMLSSEQRELIVLTTFLRQDGLGYILPKLIKLLLNTLVGKLLEEVAKARLLLQPKTVVQNRKLLLVVVFQKGAAQVLIVKPKLRYL